MKFSRFGSLGCINGYLLVRLSRFDSPESICRYLLVKLSRFSRFWRTKGHLL